MKSYQIILNPMFLSHPETPLLYAQPLAAFRCPRPVRRPVRWRLVPRVHLAGEILCCIYQIPSACIVYTLNYIIYIMCICMYVCIYIYISGNMYITLLKHVENLIVKKTKPDKTLQWEQYRKKHTLSTLVEINVATFSS